MRVVTYKAQYQPQYPHRARSYSLDAEDESASMPVLPVPEGDGSSFPWGKYFVFGIAVSIASHYAIKWFEGDKR